MVDLSYQASVEPDALPGRPNPRFPDEVSPNAYGEQVGNDIEQSSAVLQGVHQKIVAQAQQTQLADAHNQMQVLQNNLTHDQTNGAFTKQGKNAFGLNDQYLPQWDQQSSAIVASVADPKAREAAAQASQTMRAQLSEQLDSHELDQHKKFADQTDLASVHLAQQVGPANYNNPNILAANHDTMATSLENMASRNGWSDDQLNEAKQEANSKFHSDVIDRILADNKFPMAQTYLNANKPDMDANSAWHAQQTITSHLKEKQNEAKADIADRYQDSLESAQFGLPNSIGVSRGELELLHPGHGARLYAGLQSLSAAGTQARSYDQMTPTQVQQDLLDHTPTDGGEGAKFAIEGYKIRERAAQQSLAARGKDPAQFAIDSGAGWHPIDFSDAPTALAELKLRANTQNQVSQQVGVGTPILTKQDTTKLTGYLNGLSAQQQIPFLQQLRQAMPDDHSYGTLISQIAPNSPITAMAGASMDRPTVSNQPSWFDPKFATDPVVPQRMLEGQDILRDKGEKGVKSTFPMPADKDLQTSFQAAMGGTNSDLFRGRSQLLQSTWAAYKASYAAEADHAGVSSGVLDSNLADKAASNVIGHATTFGSTSIVAPSGMDPTKLEGAINAASTAALRDAGYSDSDRAALRGYGVRELGDTLGTGRYAIIDGNGSPLKSKDGKQSIVIDLNKQFQGANVPAIDEAVAQSRRSDIGDRR